MHPFKSLRVDRGQPIKEQKDVLAYSGAEDLGGLERRGAAQQVACRHRLEQCESQDDLVALFGQFQQRHSSVVNWGIVHFFKYLVHKQS